MLSASIASSSQSGRFRANSMTRSATPPVIAAIAIVAGRRETLSLGDASALGCSIQGWDRVTTVASERRAGGAPRHGQPLTRASFLGRHPERSSAVVPSAARLSSRAQLGCHPERSEGSPCPERGAGLVIGYLNWLLVSAIGYWGPVREPLPSSHCSLPTAGF